MKLNNIFVIKQLDCVFFNKFRLPAIGSKFCLNKKNVINSLTNNYNFFLDNQKVIE